MDQRIGPIDEVIAVVTELVDGTIRWEEACRRLPAYDGVQAIDWLMGGGPYTTTRKSETAIDVIKGYDWLKNIDVKT